MVKISIIITSFNRQAYIAESIQSALDQKMPNVEIIVIDDGSTDSSWSIISAFSHMITAIRIQNGGVSKARNKGIELAAGDFIVILDSDDRLEIGALDAFATAAAKSDGKTILLGLARTIDESGTVINDSRYSFPRAWRSRDLQAAEILSGWASNWASLIPKELILEIGGYDERLFLGEDYDLNFRMIAAGAVFRSIDQYVYQVRVHAGPRLTRNVAEQRYIAMCSLFQRTWTSLKDEFLLPDRHDDRIRLAQWTWSMGRGCYRAHKRAAGDEFIALAREIAGRDARVGHPMVRAAYSILHPRDVERALEFIKALSSGFRKRIFLNDGG